MSPLYLAGKYISKSNTRGRDNRALHNNCEKITKSKCLCCDTGHKIRENETDVNKNSQFSSAPHFREDKLEITSHGYNSTPDNPQSA